MVTKESVEEKIERFNLYVDNVVQKAFELYRVKKAYAKSSNKVRAARESLRYAKAKVKRMYEESIT